MTKAQKLYLPLKRFIAICGSLVGIIVMFVLLWWWILPINAIATKGHPIFVHQRVGKNKKVFGLIKFRSMRVDADPNLAPSHMGENTQKSMETGFGKFLRKTSLDETLQLINIFKGDMAFIGPRPGAAINEEDLIAEREKYSPSAYEVRPGLSGLAQVKMYREHDPVKKAKLDHEYVVKLSLWLDIKLFVLTVLRVFRRNDGAR